MIVFYIAIALLATYGILFQYYSSCWHKVPAAETKQTLLTPATKISVIIAARNEAATIGACLSSICRQNYPRQLFQVIIIDDASTDATVAAVNNTDHAGVQVICYSLPPMAVNPAPKKRAIEKGIFLASGDLIITTDADCLAQPDWLLSLANWHQYTQQVFIAAPVKIQVQNSLLSKFQALDFLTMQGITAAAVSRQFHNMCNGANLAYKKSVFYEVEGFTGIDHIASGDDMLLMTKIVNKYPGRAGFLKAPEAIITTAPADSWKAFLQQRIRWASKATHYHQPKIFFVLLLVYLTNLFIFCFLLLGFFQPFAWLLFVFLCITKFFMELFFVQDVARFFNQQRLVRWLFILQPLHILYIVLSGFLGQVGTYQWKGRKLK